MPGMLIKALMDTCYQRLSNRNFRWPELCSLRSFNFRGGGPDYNNPLHRDFYMLRYAPAYISEYYLVFKHIFAKKFLMNGACVSVLSLGCGALLDLIGFEYARRATKQFRSATPYYYGIDIVDWRFDINIIDNIDICFGGIARCPHDQNKYDIIIFPKSISDLNESELIVFARSIQSRCLYEKICIINAKRNNAEYDTRLVQRFCSEICNSHGYRIEDYTCRIWNRGNEDIYFSHILKNGYEYPDCIIKYLKNIRSNCIAPRCLPLENDECKTILDRYPILKAKNACPEIYYLVKQ